MAVRCGCVNSACGSVTQTITLCKYHLRTRVRSNLHFSITSFLYFFSYLQHNGIYFLGMQIFPQQWSNPTEAQAIANLQVISIGMDSYLDSGAGFS